MRILNTSLMMLALVSSSGVIAASSEIEAGRNAIEQGHYQTAKELLMPLATRGDQEAMTLLLSLPNDPVALPMRSDERKALERLEQSDTREHRRQLGLIRNDLAVDALRQYEQSGEYLKLDHALLYAQSAVELAPDSNNAWATYALAHLQNKADPFSRDMAQIALERVSAKMRNLLPLQARVQLMNGDFEKSARTYIEILELNPNAMKLINPDELNLALIKSQLWRRGIRAYDYHLSNFGDSGDLRISRAVLLRMSGLNDQAHHELKQVARSSDYSSATRKQAKAVRQHWIDVGNTPWEDR
ncbi:MAG: hypothetical protein KC477_10905 [Oceanospirillaceae bacterium]|nr:hypothetical protein [Oceanospirillaceae bacterium]